jgi:hypothetical protein
MVLMSFYASMRTIGLMRATFFGCNMQIIGSTKCLQSIAGFIVERDSEIRKAALSTLAVSYKVLGSDLKIFKTHMNPCISWLPSDILAVGSQICY